MTEITLCKVTMKVNKREETFARIIKQEADRLLEYYHANKFERRTYDRLLTEIDHHLNALFFMGLFNDPVCAFELEAIRKDESFLEYMLGPDWVNFYEN